MCWRRPGGQTGPTLTLRCGRLKLSSLTLKRHQPSSRTPDVWPRVGCLNLILKVYHQQQLRSTDLRSGATDSQQTEQREVLQWLTVCLHSKGDQSEQQQRSLHPERDGRAAPQPSCLHGHGTVCSSSPLFCLTSALSAGQDPPHTHTSSSLLECVCVWTRKRERAKRERERERGGGGVAGMQVLSVCVCVCCHNVRKSTPCETQLRQQSQSVL